MLLHEEIRDDNVANNGEVFIDVFGLRKVIPNGLWYYDLLEDQKYDKIIPWEVDLKLQKKLTELILPVFLMEMVV